MTSSDLYTWRVLHTDGQYTSEYDDERPDGRGWHEKGDEPIVSITLTHVEYAADIEHMIHIPDDASPVFFRRRRVNLGTQEHTAVHCIGWKRDGYATIEEVYLFVFENGSTLLTSDFQAV